MCCKYLHNDAVDLKAVVTVDVFVYKMKAFSGTDKNEQDHIFLPTNKIMKLKRTKSADGHNYSLLITDIANQKRGYSLFLPSTNSECIQYYLYLYGTQLNIEKGNCLHFVEVQEDDGYSSIVPSCLLADCCTEMQLQSIYQSEDLIGNIVQCIGFANLRLFSHLKLLNDCVDTTESELRQTFRSAALIQLHAVCDDTSVHSNLFPDTDRLEMERSVYGNSNCGQESSTSNADLLKASLSTEAGNSEGNFRAENRKPLTSYTVSRDSRFRSVGASATDTHQISGTKQTLNSIPVPVCTDETVSPEQENGDNADINTNLTMPKHITKQKRSTVEIKCVPIDTSVEDVSQRDLRRKRGARNLSREPSFHYEKSAATNFKQNTRTRKKCKQVTAVVQAKGLEHKNEASIISSNHINASPVYPRGNKTECGLKDGFTTTANYATRGSIQKPKSSLQQKNDLEDFLVDNSTYKIGDTSVDRQVHYKATNSPTEAVRSEPLHLEREASDDFMDILFLN